MGKISRHGGPTTGPVQYPVIRRAMLGGDPKLVGENYTASSNKAQTSDGDETQSPQQPVQTTDNPSTKPQTAKEDTARMTGGSGRTTRGRKSAKSNESDKSSDSNDFSDFE
jgi:hypothetical protein